MPRPAVWEEGMSGARHVAAGSGEKARTAVAKRGAGSRWSARRSRIPAARSRCARPPRCDQRGQGEGAGPRAAGFGRRRAL